MEEVRRESGEEAMRWAIGVTVVIVVGVALGASPPSLPVVLQHLQSPDPKVRQEGIKGAVKFGASVLPHLAPLLGSKDWKTRQAARRVVERIVAEATRPGAGERKAVLGGLLGLAGAQNPLPVRRFALRMLRICGTEEVVSSLAQLLNDPSVRQEALHALQHLGTPNAAHAVAMAARRAKGEWRSALLAALGSMGQGFPVLLRALREGDLTTKTAAVNALGRLGCPEGIPVLIDALREKVPGALTALLTLGGRLLRQGRVKEAWEAFSQALRFAVEPHERCAVLFGLARSGKGKAVPILLKALSDPDPSVRRSSEEALIQCPDDINRALEAAYQKAPPLQRRLLLRVLVSRKAPSIITLLRQAIKDIDEGVRERAFQLIGEMGLDELKPVLWNEALRGDETAQRSYLALAMGKARKGDLGEARSMAEHIVLVADKKGWVKWRDGGLQLLTLLADPRSLPILEPFLRRPDLPFPVLEALLAISETAAKRRQKALAEALVMRVLERQLRREWEGRLKALWRRLEKPPSDLARRLGFLTDWWLLGPLPNPQNEAFDKAFFEETRPPELKAPLKVGRQTLMWRFVHTQNPFGIVTLHELFSPKDWVACYAYTAFFAPKGGEVELRVGSDDSIKVWLNGELVHHFQWMRGLRLDADRVRVRLNPGLNWFLLKVTQGRDRWEFCVRLVDLQGNAIPFQIPSATFGGDFP